MVTAYLFDRRQGEPVEKWAESLHRLGKNQVLWIDLIDASEGETAEVLDALDLGDAGDLKLGDPERKPAIEEHEGHLRMTAVAISDAEHNPARERIVVDCFVGSNWLLTAHSAGIAVLDDFRAAAEGKGAFGLLDAPSYPLSSEGSAERFMELTARLDAALAAARDTRDGIASSFDVLIVRTEHRTNEIIKVLTLASILLLPGALLAGVAGMNVNFGLQTFVHSALFWVVIAAIVLIAMATLAFARLRRWI